MLKLQNVSAGVDADPILKNINLEVNPGEIHAVLGPSGSGKSALAHLIQGSENIIVLEGTMTYAKKSILKLAPYKRTRLGIFTTFQSPPEIEGLSNLNLVKATLEAKTGGVWNGSVEESYKTLLKTVGLDSHFHEAGVNTVSQPPEDWKKNEIVQLLMSRPTIGIVDQIDEDLDDETLDYIILMLKNYLKTNEKVSLIIISNNMKFLDQMEPHFVHVLVNGKIAETGDKELYKRIISDGNPQLS